MQDLDTKQSQSQNHDNPDLDKSNKNLEEVQEATSEENILQTFLKLKEHGQSSRTKALRLKKAT